MLGKFPPSPFPIPFYPPLEMFQGTSERPHVSSSVSVVTTGEGVAHLQGRRLQEQHAEGVRDRGAEGEDPGEAQQGCGGTRPLTESGTGDVLFFLARNLMRNPRTRKTDDDGLI